MPNSVPGKPIFLVKFIADYRGVWEGQENPFQPGGFPNGLAGL